MASRRRYVGDLLLFRDGIDAVGFPPGDTVALTRLLAELIAHPDLRARIGNEARRTALRAFAPDRLPEAVEAIYGRVARLQIDR